MYNIFRGVLAYLIYICVSTFLFTIIVLVSIYVRKFKSKIRNKPRLVWGNTPIANNIYWSRAMKSLGFSSQTYVTNFYFIHTRKHWDLLLTEKYVWCPVRYKGYFAFIESLLNYDVFFISYDGFFLGQTHYWDWEAKLLHISKKKVVVIPYGSDAFVYGRIRSTAMIHGLMMSYPDAAKRQHDKSERLDYWNKYADFVLPSMMGADGFGRWDVLMPSSLAIDVNEWRCSGRKSDADGKNGVVFIAHAPNHRGFKGTEFVVDVINKIKGRGYKVELVLLENIPNELLRKKFENDIDILVEQLIAPGYGLNGVEGMASGLCVISNMEDEAYMNPLRRWSFLSECPIVSGSPESIEDVLIKLITNPALRNELGDACRLYIEKYHSLETCQYLFSEILEFIYDKRPPLINLFHPLLGEYRSVIPKISHPLVNNKIIT